MNWFLIALINPIAHAFVNHFDKYLLSKYVKGGTVGALILFSALFAVVALPIIYLVNPDVISSVTFTQAIILMVNGALLTIAILFYLYAMDTDEASYVAPFAQLVPVFGLLLGYFILGEVLTRNQLLAGVLILLGGIVLSIELAVGKGRIKKNLILFSIGATFFYALNAVIFKWITVDQSFLDSLFWDMLGKFIFGIILFFGIRSYRKEFLSLLKTNGAPIFGLNVFGEILSLGGEIALVYAVLLAPVALVQSVSGLQPAFVLVIGVLITIFFPRFGQESLERKFIIQKVLGIGLVIIGVYLLERL